MNRARVIMAVAVGVLVSMGSVVGDPMPGYYSEGMIYDPEAYDVTWSQSDEQAAENGDPYWVYTWTVEFHGIVYLGVEEDGEMTEFGVYDPGVDDPDSDGTIQINLLYGSHTVEHRTRGSVVWDDVSDVWGSGQISGNYVVAFEQLHPVEQNTVLPGEAIRFVEAFDAQLSLPDYTGIHIIRLGDNDEYSQFTKNTDDEYGEDEIPELGTWLLLGCSGVFAGWLKRRRQPS